MVGKAKKSTHGKKASSKALAKRRSSKAPVQKKRVEIDETKHYDIAEIGPVYLEWGKKKTKNAKGKIVKEYYLKKESKHRIWVKWVDPFQDVLEEDNDLGTDCKWSAEPQTIFEGNMKKMVKEALEKKVVWPWVAPNEDDSSRRKNILKSSGFKEWKNPKAKSAAENKWKLRYAIEAKTDTSGQSGSDSDGTSSTTDKEGEDDDEDDEV